MTTGEIISLVISILSVAIVVYQSIVLRRTIGNQIYESFIDNSVELDKLLIEKPGLRKYIYHNEPITGEEPDLDMIMSAVEMVVDITENIDVYKKYIPANRRDGWLQFVHDMESSSAYIFYMEKYSTWYVKRNGKQQNKSQTK